MTAASRAHAKHIGPKKTENRIQYYIYLKSGIKTLSGFLPRKT